MRRHSPTANLPLRNLDLTVCADPVVTHNTVSGDALRPALVHTPARSRAWLLAASIGADGASDCRPAAIERLRAAAPAGFAIPEKTKGQGVLPQLDQLWRGGPWFADRDPRIVHDVTAETDAFPLLNGGRSKRPHEVSAFFAPAQIAARFKASDFVMTYLRPGAASSSGDFLYLLDELNAYTHDLATAVSPEPFTGRHRRGRSRRSSRRACGADGVRRALCRARGGERACDLARPPPSRALHGPMSELWGQAEKTMVSSCGIPNFGTEDKALIRQFCQRGPQAALQKVLGRVPVCPAACLAGTPVAAREIRPQRRHDADWQHPRDPAATLRPFWSRGPGRGPARSEPQ